MILVGAQRNAPERDSDGPRNLLDLALTGARLPRVDRGGGQTLQAAGAVFADDCRRRRRASC